MTSLTRRTIFIDPRALARKKTRTKMMRMMKTTKVSMV
jgi:hypothetical protein